MGLMFSFLGSYGILTGKLYLSKENIPIPAWTGWVQLPFGIWVLFLSIRAWWRNQKNPDSESARNVTLDEEASRAEAELDAMYLREHGEPPQNYNKDTNASS